MSNFERRYSVIDAGKVVGQVLASSDELAAIRARAGGDITVAKIPIDVQVFNTATSGYADDYPWRCQGDDFCITIPNSRSKPLEIRVSPTRYAEWYDAIAAAKKNFQRP